MPANFMTWAPPRLARLASWLLGSLLALLPVTQAAAAPQAALKLVVGFSAGGAMDTLARALAAPLSERLHRPVYVENKIGAGGSIAAAYVAQSPPDGNTVLIASPAEIFIQRIFQPQLKLREIGNLVPVAKISSAPIVLATTADSPIRQVSDIARELQKRPQGLSFASSGTGSSQHLTGEIFQKTLGVELVHVPFNGAPSATTSLLGKQVDLLFAGLAPIAPHIQSQKVRILAIAGAQRSPLIPNVPTLQEMGLPGGHLEYWQGVFLPQRTAPGIASALSRDIAALVREPQFIQRLQALGYSSAFQSHEEFKAFLQQEQQSYLLAAQRVGRALP